MPEIIRFTLNGAPVSLDTDASRTLLWVLRTDLALTGTKYGCGAGICGSCTVVVDGRAVRACQAQIDLLKGNDVRSEVGDDTCDGWNVGDEVASRDDHRLRSIIALSSGSRPAFFR